MRALHSFFISLVVAVILFFGVYFFGPALSHQLFGISWRDQGRALQTSGDTALTSAEAILKEVNKNFTQWGETAGMTAKDISELVKRVDTQKAQELAAKGIDSVQDSAKELFETLRRETGK